MLTTSRENKDIETAYQLGVSSYIVKPVEFEKFSAVMPQLNFHWNLLNCTASKQAR